MASKKTKSEVKSAGTLAKNTLVELKSICKELGIECKGKKADIIASIVTAGAKNANIKKITVSTTVKKRSKSKSPRRGRSKSPARKRKGKKSPSRSPRSGSKSPRSGSKSPSSITIKTHVSPKAKKSSKKKASPKRKSPKRSPRKKSPKRSPSKSPKCKKDEITDVSSKKCLKKTTKGQPMGSVALKKKYGDDYVFDEEFGVVGRKADVESYLEGRSPRSASKSPKKSPKKSPAKKKASSKSKAKTIKSKSKTCVDEEDPLLCDEGEICSAPSGRCIKDTKVNRHGTKTAKAELNVDGRIIVGLPATIKNLQKLLGGTITLPKGSTPKKSKTPSPIRSGSKSPKKKTKTPVKKTRKLSPQIVSASSASPSPVKSAKKTPRKKTPSPKRKTPSPARGRGKGAKGLGKRASSPQTLEDIERRLEDLDDEENAEEIKKLRSKLSKLKGTKKDSPSGKTKPVKVQMKVQEIYKTFAGCLAGLNA